jgi:hypothetical protein
MRAERTAAAMTDLDAQIRAKLTQWGADPCGYGTCVVIGWGELRAAVLATLDLHGSTVAKRWNPGCDVHLPGATKDAWEAMKACPTCAGAELLACKHCDEIRWEADDVWPCPTLRTIAARLGIEVGRG